MLVKSQPLGKVFRIFTIFTILFEMWLQFYYFYYFIGNVVAILLFLQFYLNTIFTMVARETGEIGSRGLTKHRFLDLPKPYLGRSREESG